MSFVGVGEVTEVEMIGVGEMECIVETTWMGGDWIRDSMMRFGVTTCIEVTFWTGGEGTLYVMIGFGFSVVNFAISGAFFVVVSFASSGSQKKENSDFGFRCDANEVETFDGEAFSFESSASGFQKNESSEMSFVCGDTGEETIFLEGAI